MRFVLWLRVYCFYSVIAQRFTKRDEIKMLCKVNLLIFIRDAVFVCQFWRKRETNCRRNHWPTGKLSQQLMKNDGQPKTACWFESCGCYCRFRSLCHIFDNFLHTKENQFFFSLSPMTKIVFIFVMNSLATKIFTLLLIIKEEGKQCLLNTKLELQNNESSFRTRNIERKTSSNLNTFFHGISFVFATDGKKDTQKIHTHTHKIESLNLNVFTFVNHFGRFWNGVRSALPLINH